MEKKIIIVPDVHGRDFWKNDVLENENSKIIFLGDYFDPYERRDIDDMLYNFKLILTLKKNGPERVTLLIGNHDMHYTDKSSLESSRYNPHMKDVLIKNNIDFLDESIFQIITEENIGGKRFIFTHAGIEKSWAELCNMNFNKINIEEIKELFREKPHAFDLIIGFIRGGDFIGGSPLWADIREYDENKDIMDGVIQIFGHTQLEDKPINIKDSLFCLDVRRPFFIDENGIVREMNGEKI